MSTTFYSHGKLLLTSEYMVLDGAKALALPTTKGQYLHVTKTTTGHLHWKSQLHDNSLWLDCTFPLPLTSTYQPQGQIEQRLHAILLEAVQLNPDFLKTTQGLEITSVLEFPKNWGLGSSSTLITNIALWANVNPYALLQASFGGSGYDIACASANGPITYCIEDNKRHIASINFKPSFEDEIFFVHLNRKQNSRESIKHYRSLEKRELRQAVKHFTTLTEEIIAATTIASFENLLNLHEEHLSKILKTPTIKSQLFSDYTRTIKSLGGWGGDFILATGGENEKSYFKNKGYYTILSYDAMIL